MNELLFDVLESWKLEEGIYSIDEIYKWIADIKNNTHVDVVECPLSSSSYWFYDDYNGEIVNRNRSFFSVKGLRFFVDNRLIGEQPIINQPEIGYLGIICKKINGVLHFLMQAKIEPGNINYVQISPTIQATKSNFTRAHGGKLPNYIEYFENLSNSRVLYDQIQSEQSARFYKKRNRNIIIIIENEIDVLPNYKWMTLGQIKKFLEIDNLVNMDTRTVLSGIPFSSYLLNDDNRRMLRQYFDDEGLCLSIFNNSITDYMSKVFGLLNNYKMFTNVHTAIVPLYELTNWKIEDDGITCDTSADFSVKYYDIEISGREVHSWIQPLFKAVGQATYGLFVTYSSGYMEILVCIRPEMGCFDKAEIGPSIQWEASNDGTDDVVVDELFRQKLNTKEGKKVDVMLSEEGGRFYREQNRNVIVLIDKKEIQNIPDGYVWLDYKTLNSMIIFGSCINIQLRNLLVLFRR